TPRSRTTSDGRSRRAPSASSGTRGTRLTWSARRRSTPRCWRSCGSTGRTSDRDRGLTGVGGSMSVQWQAAKTYADILYEKAGGIAKITINRPEVHNAFRPGTITELTDAFRDAAADDEI